MASRREERGPRRTGRTKVTLPRPARPSKWDGDQTSDSEEEYERPPKRTTNGTRNRSNPQDSQGRPHAPSEDAVRHEDIEQALEKLAHGELRPLAQFIHNVCVTMRFILEHYPRVLPDVKKHVGISDYFLKLIQDGPQTAFVEQEELPSLLSLRSKGTPGSPASQPPSPDPRRAIAAPAETDEAPRAQRTLAGAHRTAPNHAAAAPSTGSHAMTSLLESSPAHGPPGPGASTNTQRPTAYGEQLALPLVGGSHDSVGVSNVAPGQPGAPAVTAAQTSTTLAPAPPGHGPSVPVPLSQLTQSSVWGTDPSHRTHGLQTWFPGQHFASGPAIHVGAQPGGPPAAMVHGAQAPQSAPAAAGPMPSQPPHGNIVSVQPNGGLPVNLPWSNPAAYQLFLAAQASSAPAGQHNSGSGPNVVAALPRQGVSSLDGLQSHPPQASLPPHLANMISAPTLQPPSNPFSYAPPGPFHMSAHPQAGGEPQGPWATGVTQQALDDTLLGQGDSTNYANMSLL